MSKGEETRRRIVDTALETIGVTGLARMTIGELAQSVGMSKSGLFAHFGSREGLEVEIVRELSRRFEGFVIEPAAAEAPAAALVSIFESWMTWVSDDVVPGGCPVILAMSDAGPGPGPARELLLGELARLMVVLSETFRAAGGRDEEQFLYELTGLIMAHNASVRLLGDPSRERARRGFDELLRRHLPSVPAVRS
jgi:AcrR family transcriptional regulator